MNWFVAFITFGLLCSTVAAASGIVLIVGASGTWQFIYGWLLVLMAAVSASLLVGAVTA